MQSGIANGTTVKSTKPVTLNVSKSNLVEKLYKFTRFEYSVVKTGSRLVPICDPMKIEDIFSYVNQKVPRFIKHSNENFRDMLLWDIWLKTLVPRGLLIIIDYSENLALSLKEAPQSMYYMKSQVTLHCGVGIEPSGNKTYFGHISDDREHDQVFVSTCLSEITSLLPPSNTVFIRSDNATHYKSAENFHDLQLLSNNLTSTVVRVYGIAGHGKGEIDSAGGHMKNAARKGIQMGIEIKNADEVVSYLTSKFDSYSSPSYYFNKILPNDLMEEREHRRFKKFKTIAGSDSYHVLVFSPGEEKFLASCQLCDCDHCIDMEFNLCSNFKVIEPLVQEMIIRTTRSEVITHDEDNTSVASMITKGSIFAIRASNPLTNYFLLLCESELEEHYLEKPFVDDVGHVIYAGNTYILGKYLNVTNFNNKYQEFEITKKTVAVLDGEVFFPQVPIMYTSKSGKIFRFANDIIVELEKRSLLADRL